MVLEVFRGCLSRCGDKGRGDRLFLEAMHYFAVHNITWRALPSEYGRWNSVWKRFSRLSRSGVFEAFFQALALTDKGYDAASNRETARSRGICPVIPRRSNARTKPGFFPKILYKGRARIEQTMGKLKRFKRVALRCKETAENYASIVAFACGLILVKSVHTA